MSTFLKRNLLQALNSIQSKLKIFITHTYWIIVSLHITTKIPTLPSHKQWNTRWDLSIYRKHEQKNHSRFSHKVLNPQPHRNESFEKNGTHSQLSPWCKKKLQLKLGTTKEEIVDFSSFSDILSFLSYYRKIPNTTLFPKWYASLQNW